MATDKAIIKLAKYVVFSSLVLCIVFFIYSYFALRTMGPLGSRFIEISTSGFYEQDIKTDHVTFFYLNTSNLPQSKEHLMGSIKRCIYKGGRLAITSSDFYVGDKIILDSIVEANNNFNSTADCKLSVVGSEKGKDAFSTSYFSSIGYFTNFSAASGYDGFSPP